MPSPTPSSNSDLILIDPDVTGEQNRTESAGSGESITFPHPIWSEYFIKIGENRNTVGMFYAKCKLCLGRKSISCSYGSAGNLKRHIEVSYIVQIMFDNRIELITRTFFFRQNTVTSNPKF